LAPNIALGHISPDSSILQNSLSLTIFANPIPFKDDNQHNVKFLFMLTSVDGSSHIEIMSAFTSVLSNENFRNNLNKIKNYQD
jgi:PTS system ascorbate-specific IIA component